METEQQKTNTGITVAEFELLFKKQFKGLCFFAQRYVKDIETAKEVVQDAFVALWEKRETIDPSKAVHSYLSTAVYNKSLNYLRDSKKFDKDILIAENLFSDSGYKDSDPLVAKEIAKLVDSSIQELPEKCREVFLMNRFENLKYQEIADKLSISVKTVESHISKALQHMRVRLAEYITILLIIFELTINK